MALIIVEGPDRAGKSTLCKKLAAQLGAANVAIFHRGVPTQHPLDEYEAPLWPYRPGRGLGIDGPRHVICDRWHLGEVVYPRVVGRKTQLDEPTLLHIELTLQARGALLVVVGGDKNILHARLGAAAVAHGPKPSGVRPEHAEALVAGFWNASVVSLLDTWHVPRAEDVTLTVLDLIIGRARSLEQKTAFLADFITYVGPPYPRALLLGDRRGKPGVKLPGYLRDAPAFVPYPVTSGHFLLGALGRSRVFELGLANARDVDHVPHLWALLGYPPLVTLGALARNAVARMHDAFAEEGRLPSVAELPHPQYVRRFNHRAQELYGRAVGNAIGQHGPQPWNLREGWADAPT